MTGFAKRLNEYLNELKTLYFSLYGEDQESFESFLGMLRKYHRLRSPKLKAWDKKRADFPDWYRDNRRLGMLMYAGCFAGSIKGVREHLPYLIETGINCLHLMPIMKSPKGRSDGGYAVSDFRTVEPGLGDISDFSDLALECHEHGISLCLDFVMNHTSEDHEWAKRAVRGDKEAQNRYFFYDDRTVPDEFEKYMPQVFPTTAPGNFTWCEEAHKVVMTTFHPYQWDLNYRNPTVFNDMAENMLFLCNCGVDIVRLDATPYIWKTSGTSCRNLPEVHTLVRMLHIAADIVCPGTLLLGEVVMKPEEVVPYFGSLEKPECHLLYNVTTMASIWHTVATKDVRLLEDRLKKVFALPKEYVFLNYLRCHDDIGWGLDYEFLKAFGIEESAHKRFLNDYFCGSVFESGASGELYNDDPGLKDARLCGTTASLCGIETAESEKDKEKLERGIVLDIMLHAFLLSLSGIPVLYSGDEIGQFNDHSYHEDPLKKDDSRYLHRGSFSWEDAKKRRRKTTRQGRIYSAVKKLGEIRAGHDVFCSSADAWVMDAANNSVLAFGRYYKGEKLIAVYNFSPDPQTVHISESGVYKDMMTGRIFSEDMEVELSAWGFYWLMDPGS